MNTHNGIISLFLPCTSTTAVARVFCIGLMQWAVGLSTGVAPRIALSGTGDDAGNATYDQVKAQGKDEDDDEVLHVFWLLAIGDWLLVISCWLLPLNSKH